MLVRHYLFYLTKYPHHPYRLLRWHFRHFHRFRTVDPAVMAFFKPGGSQPEYETAIRMVDNGVGIEFLFDYGDFSIRAKLDNLEELPAPRC